MDIGAWLRSLDLQRYEPVFRENEISAEVLPELTDADLRELGLPLGPRKTLLKAIALLRQPAGPTQDVSADRHPAPSSATRTQAERRQLTVMFADLVGSTALSNQLDPEELRVVMRSYQDTCAAAVRHLEGHVAKYMGDGVLAYFGWPQAHEDEAERAVRAGIETAGAVAGLKTPAGQPLAARVGIATGLVVVGDLIGEGAAREEAVVGEVPNVAARLQQLAAPNTVVIAESTRRLLGGAFDLNDLGAVALRGLTEPVRAWQVLGEGRMGARFEAREMAGLTPLVGREHEIALLLERWRLARQGEGQVVFLAGEPGIGKSRIVSALREELGDDPHTLLLCQCSPLHMGSALHPIIAYLERAAGFQRTDSAGVRLEKLEDLLGRESSDPSAVVPVVAALLGIATEGRYPGLDLTPQQRKEKTLETLLDLLESSASSQPVLLIFEDLHWVDQTSLELLRLLVERTRNLSMLVVLTARPEFTPPWTSGANATVLTLGRLASSQAASLVERVSGKPIPAEVLDPIVSRTDGVPLFVEELTRTVLESNLLEQSGNRYVLRGPLPDLAIPATLQDSLMARLDRLGEVKEIAQVAACLGREFTHDMLAAVTPWDETRLRAALDRLAGSDLILRHGRAPLGTYSFRHALVQEAAYQSVLKSKRQELHAQIAKAVEDRFPRIAELQPEWLAHHYTEAGMAEPAAAHWIRAAERAKEAYANREAMSHLQTCLTMIHTRSGDGTGAAGLADRKLRALVLLGDLASLGGDLASANRYYEDALALGQEPQSRVSIENKQHRPRVAVRNGARIAFYEHGVGPQTLVFIAPLAYGLATFQPIVERLCQEFRIVTVDARGVGASDPFTRPYPLSEHVEDANAVLKALGGEPVVGVGISRGSNLLLKLAHAKPHLFSKLITVGGSPAAVGPPFFSAEYLRLYRALADKGDLEGIVRLHTSFMFSEPATRELQELFVRNRLALPRETMLSFFSPDPTVDVRSILGEVRVPVLVTHGTADRLISFDAAEFIMTQLPDARLYAFDGKGHMPLFTAPDEFCEVLRRFVRGGTSAFPKPNVTA